MSSLSQLSWLLAAAAPAEDLPFDDATFDTVVCTLVLCGVEDQPRAVREIRRVLKPNGRLLIVEHVRSDDERLARKQDRVNWLGRLVTRCDCNRPTCRTLQRGGFATDGLLASQLPKSPAFVRPLVIGAAIPADAHAGSVPARLRTRETTNERR